MLKVEDFFRSKLALYHTLLVSGKDDSETYVCFHREGPGVRLGFETKDLDSILAFYLPHDESQYYMAMVGPIKNSGES